MAVIPSLWIMKALISVCNCLTWRVAFVTLLNSFMFMPPILPVFGQVLASSIPSVVNTIGGLKQNSINIANNWRVLQAQQDFSRQMANEERAYNTPQNQLQLAIQAGLNPNFLQNGAGFVPTSQAPVPSEPNMNQPNPFALQMDSPSQATLANSQTGYNKSLKQTEDDLRKGKVDSLYMDIDLKKVQKNLTNEEVSFTAKRILALDKQMGLFDKQMDLLRSQRWLTDAQTSWYDTQTRYKPYEYTLAFKQAMQNIAESRSRSALNYRSMSLIDANIGQIKAFTRSLILGNKFQDQTFKFRLGQEKNKWFLLHYQQGYQRKVNDKFTFDFSKQVEWYDVNQGFKLASQIFGAINQGLSTYEHVLDIKDRDFHKATELMRSVPFVGAGGSPSPTVQSTYAGWNPSF